MPFDKHAATVVTMTRTTNTGRLQRWLWQQQQQQQRQQQPWSSENEATTTTVTQLLFDKHGQQMAFGIICMKVFTQMCVCVLIKRIFWGNEGEKSLSWPSEKKKDNGEMLKQIKFIVLAYLNAILTQLHDTFANTLTHIHTHTYTYAPSILASSMAGYVDFSMTPQHFGDQIHIHICRDCYCTQRQYVHKGNTKAIQG